MRRFITVVLVLALIAVAGNDIWRYTQAKSRLTEATYQLAKYAADASVTKDRDTVASEISQMAQPFGIVVYQYGQEERTVQLWTQTEVGGTIIVGPVINLVNGIPFSEALNASFTIREFRRAGI